MRISVKPLLLLAFLFLGITPSISIALDKKNSSMSHFIMAVVNERLGDLDAAIQEYQKAISDDYQNAALHLNLAAAFIKNNQSQKAQDELNLAIKYDPVAPEPHAVLALLYFSQDKIDKAAQEYENALKNASRLDPRNTEIYKRLALTYIQQRKFREAEKTYKLILEIKPEDSESHFYLGSIYDELRDKETAKRELRKSIELNPSNHEALNYLGYIFVEENRELDQAEGMIKKALEIQPTNGAYLDSMGWLYYKKGDYERALKLLQNAARMLDDPVILDHLGDAYLKINDVKSALDSWQKSIKLDPGQTQVKLKLDKLKTKQ